MNVELLKALLEPRSDIADAFALILSIAVRIVLCEYTFVDTCTRAAWTESISRKVKERKA